jgi:hypothetical protein
MRVENRRCLSLCDPNAGAVHAAGTRGSAIDSFGTGEAAVRSAGRSWNQAMSAAAILNPAATSAPRWNPAVCARAWAALRVPLAGLDAPETASAAVAMTASPRAEPTSWAVEIMPPAIPEILSLTPVNAAI